MFHLRVAAATATFNTALTSGKFTGGEYQIFENALVLLNRLIDRIKRGRIDYNTHRSFDIIIIGTVTALIMLENNKLGRTASQPPYGLTHTYPKTWLELLTSEKITSETDLEIQHLIEIVGKKVLIDQSYPLFSRHDFVPDSPLWMIIADTVTEERLEANYGKYASYRQETLYVEAYQAQEAQHAARQRKGKILAIFAAIFPPLSLFLTIQEEKLNRARWTDLQLQRGGTQPAPYPRSLWMSVLNIIGNALIPVLSGFSSWACVKKIDDIHRGQDNIIQTIYPGYIATALNVKEAFKRHKDKRETTKNSRQDVDWSALKSTRKPKKVVVINKGIAEIYRDRPQQERLKIFEGHGQAYVPGTDTVFSNFNSSQKLASPQSVIGFFKANHQQSVDILDKLEQSAGYSL